MHGRDIYRIQKFLDPIIITSLFVCWQGNIKWSTPFASVPYWLIIFFVSIVLLHNSSLYESRRNRKLINLFTKINSSWLVIFTIMLLFAYFNKSTATLSRVATSSWFISVWIWLICTHIFVRIQLRRMRINGGNSRTIVYWGDHKAACKFAEQLQINPWLGLKIKAWFSSNQSFLNDESPSYLPECSGGLDEAQQWLKSNKVDKIIFSFDHDAFGPSIKELINVFGNLSIPIVYAPYWSHSTMKFTYEAIGEQPCLELWGSNQSFIDKTGKNIFDLILASIGTVTISPILIAISIAIKATSPGPILYKQDRYGFNGERFTCLKFRTMYYEQNEDKQDIKQATLGDARITPFGKLLRKWSLDELPQLFNVIRGEMSLVGPRPHAVEHNEMYRKLIPGYMQRHAYKPGITGLAQISGFRGETKKLSEMENRIIIDLEYQRDWSLWRDIEILIKTIIFLKSDNAY